MHFVTISNKENDRKKHNIYFAKNWGMQGCLYGEKLYYQ